MAVAATVSSCLKCRRLKEHTGEAFEISSLFPVKNALSELLLYI